MRLRSILVMVIVSALSCATPAAARYGYCEVKAYGLDRYFLTGILDFGEDGENSVAIRSDFSGVTNRPVNRIECEVHYARAHEAESGRKGKISVKPGDFDDTGWTGRYAAAGSFEKPKSSGAFISIKDNGIAARTKAWDDAVLQGQRVEAQRRVAAAVVSAQQDAKIKALIAAEMDKMRKRGRKQ